MTTWDNDPDVSAALDRAAAELRRREGETNGRSH